MNKMQRSLAALAAAGTLSIAMPAPAYADGAASTRNIILGAAALAGIAIESNIAHKNAEANSISGYLPDGAAVYGDGHVVNPNGYAYDPGNNGQTVSCSNGYCAIGWNARNDANGTYFNGSNASGYRSDDDNAGNWRNDVRSTGNDGRRT